MIRIHPLIFVPKVSKGSLRLIVCVRLVEGTSVRKLLDILGWVWISMNFLDDLLGLVDHGVLLLFEDWLDLLLKLPIGQTLSRVLRDSVVYEFGDSFLHLLVSLAPCVRPRN